MRSNGLPSPTLGARGPATRHHSSTGTRHSRALLGGLLLLVTLLTGCELAAGETRRGDQPFYSIGEQLSRAIAASTFPWTPPTNEVGAIGQAGAVPDAAAAVTVRIAAGGTGVSLRSDCADAARAGGAWADGTQADVVEYGSGRCAGWTRATTGNLTSWVRDEYLQGLPPVDQRSTPPPAGGGAAAGSPQLQELRGWTSRLVDDAGRLALLSRHSPESTESSITGTFIETLREEVQALADEIRAAAPSGNTACDGARQPLIDGATALGDLAQRMRPTFADGADAPSGLEAIAARYAAAQSEAARLIADCARG